VTLNGITFTHNFVKTDHPVGGHVDSMISYTYIFLTKGKKVKTVGMVTNNSNNVHSYSTAFK
jgi:hypothetical protein